MTYQNTFFKVLLLDELLYILGHSAVVMLRRMEGGSMISQILDILSVSQDLYEDLLAAPSLWPG